MPCVMESSLHVMTNPQDWIAMSKKGIATQVGLVRLCRISREGTHIALSRALQPLAQDGTF
jgi:hypothetical protein